MDISLKDAHEAIASDVRSFKWEANCAGEIHVVGGKYDGFRIGHFQGDAKLAEFAVAAHNSLL